MIASISLWVSVVSAIATAGDTQFLSFFNGDLFFMWIHNMSSVRGMSIPQEFSRQRRVYNLQQCNFFLRKNFESSIFFHAFDFFQTSDHVWIVPQLVEFTQPTVVDEIGLNERLLQLASAACFLVPTNRSLHRLQLHHA